MAGIHNAKHVSVDRDGGGNFSTLSDYFNKGKAKLAPYNETNISANGQFNLLDSTGFPGTIALGTTSTENNGGYVAAALPGAVGTASTNSLSDSRGIVARAYVRDATTHDPILDANGRTVYALLQAASTVTDGDAIGAAASENIQVSYVVYDDTDTAVLTSVTGTIELSLRRLYAKRHGHSFEVESGSAPADVIAAAAISLREYTVTAAFAANEVITVSTGTGAGSGTSTPTGDTISSIGVDAATFNTTNTTKGFINGTRMKKGVQIIWDSSTTFHFSEPMSIDDLFCIEV